uniref:ribosomal protein S4 n=1 Tax=Zygnema cf. cylindricum TaxID=3142258 RepID=UPI0031F46DC0
MVSSKFKVSRRIVENIWIHKKLTPKQNTIVWRLKQKANRKQSDFAKQLQHRTKLSMLYGNLPISKIKSNQSASHLDKQKSLLFNLETRLDVILVRANFCSTLFAARQLIVHGKICVNFKRVNLPAFSVSNGDIVSISQDYFECMQSIIRQNFSNKKLFTKPSHLEVNYKTLNAVLLYEPCRIHFAYQIELDLI